MKDTSPGRGCLDQNFRAVAVVHDLQLDRTAQKRGGRRVCGTIGDGTGPSVELNMKVQSEENMIKFVYEDTLQGPDGLFEADDPSTNESSVGCVQ